MERASRGEVTLPPEAVLEFAKSCKDAVTVQLNKEKSYKIRMSGLGRPVCQQLLEKRGIEQETKYNLCLPTFLESTCPSLPELSSSFFALSGFK